MVEIKEITKEEHDKFEEGKYTIIIENKKKLAKLYCSYPSGAKVIHQLPTTDIKEALEEFTKYLEDKKYYRIVGV